MTLAVGERAPEFTLYTAAGERVALSELTKTARHSVVVFFYPKDDTPGCRAEACGFRDLYEEFARAGAEVVGISSDDAASHKRFAEKHRLPMKLLSDPGHTVRRLYDVRPTLGLLPGRATFVVDSGGIVRYVFVSQLRAVTHVQRALEVVRRIEHEKATVAPASASR